MGYYLRGSKRVWLNSSDELLAVLEDIGAKGRGSIWAVDKRQHLGSRQRA